MEEIDQVLRELANLTLAGKAMDLLSACPIEGLDISSEGIISFFLDLACASQPPLPGLHDLGIIDRLDGTQRNSVVTYLIRIHRLRFAALLRVCRQRNSTSATLRAAGSEVEVMVGTNFARKVLGD